ncbi:MAG: hypothetical protein ABI679_11045 [Gemmatimonadota bacterium]
MSPNLILIGLFLAFALVAAVFLYRRPRATEHLEEITLNDLRRCIDILLARGYDLGFVVFELPGDQRFIEFSKYVKDENTRGVQLDFPRAPWAEPYYEQVKALLERVGVPYTVEDTPDGPVREFIQVDFSHDVERAAAVARDIFERVFGIGKETRLTADFAYVEAR